MVMVVGFPWQQINSARLKRPLSSCWVSLLILVLVAAVLVFPCPTPPVPFNFTTYQLNFSIGFAYPSQPPPSLHSYYHPPTSNLQVSLPPPRPQHSPNTPSLSLPHWGLELLTAAVSSLLATYCSKEILDLEFMDTNYIIHTECNYEGKAGSHTTTNSDARH